jgi:RHS repeat-associated protein
MVALADRFAHEVKPQQSRTARNSYRPQNAYPRNFLQPQNRGPARKNRVLSTKYLDDCLGWYYYGYRYYSPELGRWGSRDPIEERGGENLYCFVANQPIGLVDLLGMYRSSKAFYRDAAGTLKQLSSSTSPSSIRIDYDIPSGESRAGQFDIDYLSHRVVTIGIGDRDAAVCFVRVLYRIRLNKDFESLGDSAPAGTINVVRYHYNGAPPYRLSAWGKKWPSGLSAKGAVVAHERGHASVYIAEVDSLLGKLDAMFDETFDDYSDEAIKEEVDKRINDPLTGGWMFDVDRAHRTMEAASTWEKNFYTSDGWTLLTGSARPSGIPSSVDDVWRK